MGVLSFFPFLFGGGGGLQIQRWEGGRKEKILKLESITTKKEVMRKFTTSFDHTEHNIMPDDRKMSPVMSGLFLVARVIVRIVFLHS